MDRITFISVEDKDVEFEKELIKSCKAFTEEACGEGLVTEATEQTLLTFKSFLEIHNYEPKNASIELPVQSNDLKQYVDENTLKIIQNLDIEELKNLLDLAEMFDCDMLRSVCLVAVQCQLYIADKKKFIEKFKQENGIDEDFTPEEENEIIEESLVVLKEIMQTYDNTHPDYKPKQFDDNQEDDEEKIMQQLQQQLEEKGVLQDDEEEEKNN